MPSRSRPQTPRCRWASSTARPTTGGPWWRSPTRRRSLAKAGTQGCPGLSGCGGDDESRLVVLLTDIRVIFDERETDRLASADLVEALGKIEGRPWAEYGRTGKPVSQNQLARLLRPLGIVSGTIRTASGTSKGYHLEAFREAFDRYLPSLGASKPCKRHNADEMGTSGGFQTVTRYPMLRLRNRRNPITTGIVTV